MKPKTGSTEQSIENWTMTYYTRDAQGNVMAVYDNNVTSASGNATVKLTLTETDIYGSSRLGVEQQLDRFGLASSISFDFTGYTAEGNFDGMSNFLFHKEDAVPLDHVMGNKQYELSNHLGNVNVVISDRKLSVDGGTYTSAGAYVNSTPDGNHDYYLPDVLSTTDYYSFGSPMPGRNYNSTDYRYNFNGKESDFESVGTGGGVQNYGQRIYNPSLGKFLSVDPIAASYPHYSPYQFAGDKPINSIDLDGLEDMISFIERTPTTSFISNNYKNDVGYDMTRYSMAKAIGLPIEAFPTTGALTIQIDHPSKGGPVIKYAYTPTAYIIEFRENMFFRTFSTWDRWLISIQGHDFCQPAPPFHSVEAELEGTGRVGTIETTVSGKLSEASPNDTHASGEANLNLLIKPAMYEEMASASVAGILRFNTKRPAENNVLSVTNTIAIGNYSIQFNYNEKVGFQGFQLAWSSEEKLELGTWQIKANLAKFADGKLSSPAFNLNTGEDTKLVNPYRKGGN